MTITAKDKAQQRQSSASSTMRSQGSGTLLSGASTPSNASNETRISDCAAYMKPKEYWPTQRQSAHATSGNKTSFPGGGTAKPKGKPSDTKMKDASTAKASKDKSKASSSPSSSDSSSSDSSSDSSSEDEADYDEELTPEEKDLIRVRRVSARVHTTTLPRLVLTPSFCTRSAR